MKVSGQWMLLEVVTIGAVIPVSVGYVVSWDVMRGIGKLEVDSRVWVGSLNSRAGVMTPKVKQFWDTKEGVRFDAGKKTYELRRVESSGGN